MVSPVKLGREPVGSPTKIGSVSRPMAVAVFCAAEKVWPADDDEQRAAPADLAVRHQVVQQRLGEEGVAAAVPAQVDDEARRAAVRDEPEQPVAERAERLGRVVPHRIELEVHQVSCGQVLEPVRQVPVPQVQRPRPAGHRVRQRGPAGRIAIPPVRPGSASTTTARLVPSAARTVEAGPGQIIDDAEALQDSRSAAEDP